MSKQVLSTPVHGNYEDKYNSKNLISKFLVSNFIRTFENTLRFPMQEGISTICEIGCGEGELLKIVHSVFPTASLHASDISSEEIEKAKHNCGSIHINYAIQDAENLQEYGDSLFDLVICCEVLEHLYNPLAGLKELLRISKNYVLVSVPNEPIWRLMNMARGKYIRFLGNTPGHLNHWSVIQFPRFLTTLPNSSIIKRRYSLPWQMVLLKKNSFKNQSRKNKRQERP